MGFVETHLDKAGCEREAKELAHAGWTVSYSPAKPSSSSETGTQGGTMLLHKPWLQTAIPVEAVGPAGQELPIGGDIVWNIGNWCRRDSGVCHGGQD